MTFFSASRPRTVPLPIGDTASNPREKPRDAGARWLDWLSRKLFDVDVLDLELARDDLPNAPGVREDAPTEAQGTPSEASS